MDKVTVSGAVDTGSIPVRDTRETAEIFILAVFSTCNLYLSRMRMHCICCGAYSKL